MQLTRRMDLYQVCGHGQQGCFDAFLRTRPGRSPQTIERGAVALTTRVLLHHAEAVRRNVQFGAIRILQLHELPTLVLNVEKRHAAIASDPVVDVHDALTGTEGGKVVEKLRSTAGGRRLFLFLFAKNIGVAQEYEAHLGPDKALAEMADTEQERSRTEHVVGEDGGTCSYRATGEVVRRKQFLHTPYFEGGMTEYDNTQGGVLPLPDFGDEALQPPEKLRCTVGSEERCCACHIRRVIAHHSDVDTVLQLLDDGCVVKQVRLRQCDGRLTQVHRVWGWEL